MLQDVPELDAEDAVLFSLVFDEKTVNFQARTPEECAQFIEAFTVVIERRSGAVSRPFNVRHVSHVDEAFRWSGKSVEDTFELGEEIGRGSFAEVYRAKHRETKFQVAAKVLRNIGGHNRASNGMMRKARRESANVVASAVANAVDQTGKNDGQVRARKSLEGKSFDSDMNVEEVLLLQCRHPNIVSYYGSSRDKSGRLWILTELCEIGSIIDLLKKTEVQNLTEEQISVIMKCTLQGLEYLHSKSIVHRDVKGSNILLSRQAQLKLTDFGVSRQVDTETQGKKAKGAGTLLWMVR